MEKRKQLTFAFEVEEALRAPAMRLAGLLGFNKDKGITVTAVADGKNGVSLKDGKAVIHYAQKHVFFRELGVLCEHARKSDAFEIFESTHFEQLSVMIDTSRCGVPSVEKINEMTALLAVMGYGMVMLYTEDTVTLEDRPYFGYMRGRYTCDDLRAVDDYAYEFGIEVIPCLECYGHMNRYLIWSEAKPIKDTRTVLLAREEATFEFVEQLIRTVSGCFRSKRVHIGMDEAWDMGRGKFLDKHGYVPPAQIFEEYMERLIAITDKLGLRPMMWSDMYYRASGTPYGGDPDNYMLPDEIVAKIPASVELVYWHYGEQPWSDERMIKSHKATGHHVIYAGGLWGWIGHFPEHHYAMRNCRFALDACRKHGVTEAMITIWTNDNAECDLFANLFGLSFFAECCYNDNLTADVQKARFEACTGADFDAFYEMANYHNNFDDESRFDGNGGKDYRFRYMGKPLFWQDVLEGLYDKALWDYYPMNGHYAACTARMKTYMERNKGSRWDYLYEFAYLVFDYLTAKTAIADRLVPAYLADDRATLAKIAATELPALIQKTEAVHAAHREMWFEGRNMIGWCNLDIRYAGVAARCKTAKLLLERYLDGKIDAISSLAQTRLEKKPTGFSHYSDMATPNEKV